MTAFFLLFSKINRTYTFISNQYLKLIEMIPRLEKVSELYEKESRLRPGPLELDQMEGKIELVDVCFSSVSLSLSLTLVSVSLSVRSALSFESPSLVLDSFSFSALMLPTWNCSC